MVRWVAGEIDGGHQVVEQAREDVERLMAVALGQWPVKEPPRRGNVGSIAALRKDIVASSAQRIPSGLKYFLRQSFVVDHARHHQRTDHG